MEKTEWFPASQVPVREGVYERDMSFAYADEELIYSFWDKDHGWLLSKDNVEDAYAEKYAEDFPIRSHYQELPWRGLVW